MKGRRFPRSLAPILGISLLALASCDLDRPERARNDAPPMPGANDQALAGLQAMGYVGTSAAERGGDSLVGTSPDERRIVRTGSLEAEVASFDEAAEEVAAIAARHGGFVADRTSSAEARGSRSGRLTLRLPAPDFDPALSALRRLGRVVQERVASTDVSVEAADLETRIRIKRATEARLHEILAGRTGSLADVLQVEQEIGRVVEEVERLEARRRRVASGVAMAAIEVGLREREGSAAHATLRSIGSGFDRSVEVLSASLGALVYLATFLAPWLVLTTVLWWTVRFVRHRGRQADTRS